MLPLKQPIEAKLNELISNDTCWKAFEITVMARLNSAGYLHVLADFWIPTGDEKEQFIHESSKLEKSEEIKSLGSSLSSLKKDESLSIFAEELSVSEEKDISINQYIYAKKVFYDFIKGPSMRDIEYLITGMCKEFVQRKNEKKARFCI